MLHCHHQNDYISHFNVSLIVRTKSQDSVHKLLLKRWKSQSRKSNQWHLLNFCIMVGSNDNQFIVSLSDWWGRAKSQDNVHKLQLLKRWESQSRKSNQRHLPNFCIMVGSNDNQFIVSLSDWWGGAKSQDNVHKPQLLKRWESWSRKLNQCYLLTSLTVTPYH